MKKQHIIDGEIQKKLDEVSRYLAESFIQTLVNAGLLWITLKYPSWWLCSLVGLLSAGTVATWLLCLLELLDLKKLNEPSFDKDA